MKEEVKVWEEAPASHAATPAPAVRSLSCPDMNPHLLLVNDWISEYKKLGVAAPSVIHHYCDRVETDSATTEAILRLLDDTQSHAEFLELICDQLFSYYRSKEEKLRTYAISFLPALIGIYLGRLGTRHTIHGHKYQCIDVLLLGIYNLEVVNEDGVAIERKFRIPLLSKPSVFHEPASHTIQAQAGSLTENALNRLESGSADVVVSSFGPFSEYEQLCASTRPTILMVLMKVYNSYLSSVSKESLRTVCQMCIKAMPITHPTPRLGMDVSPSSSPNFMEIMSKITPKLHFSSGFLVELAYSVYFCLYNDVVLEGRRALERIHSAAQYYLFSDVLLMTNAMRSSLRINLSYQESQESPVDISLSALSPTSVTSNVSSGIAKTAITNASFKTRKLPEDIPIIAVSAGSNLMSIDEGDEGAAEGKSQAKAAGKTQTPPGKIILNLLQKKDKKKDRDLISKSKARIENGEIGKVIREEGLEAEIGSVSSGISDSKSYGSDHEMIPMAQMNRSSVLSATKFAADHHHEDDRHTSDMSDEDGNISVPLISSDNVTKGIDSNHQTVKH